MTAWDELLSGRNDMVTVVRSTWDSVQSELEETRALNQALEVEVERLSALVLAVNDDANAVSEPLEEAVEVWKAKAETRGREVERLKEAREDLVAEVSALRKVVEAAKDDGEKGRKAEEGT